MNHRFCNLHKNQFFTVRSVQNLGHPEPDSRNKIKLYKNELITYLEKTTENIVFMYSPKWYEVDPDYPVEIIFDYTGNDVRCAHLLYSVNSEPIYDNGIPHIKIQSKNILSGTMYCKMFANKKTQKIYFRLRVKGQTPSQHILVNHIDLEVEAGRKRAEDVYTAEYIYQNGDTVKVDCINSDRRCTVQMSNPFNALVDDQVKVPVWGTGFRVKLNSVDDGKKVQCVSYCSGLKSSTVETTFLLQKATNDTIIVKINYQDVKANKINSEDGAYYINYAYFYNDKIVTIICDTNSKDLVVDVSCKDCNITGQDKNTISLIPNIMAVLTCTYKSQSNNTKKDVVIGFQRIASQDNSLLILQGLNQNNILYESHVYEHNHCISFINYTYQYETIFKLNCSINPEVSFNRHRKFISFNHTDTTLGNTSYTKYVSLKTKDDHKDFSCRLKNFDNENETIAQISVLFLLNDQHPIISSTEVPDINNNSAAVTKRSSRATYFDYSGEIFKSKLVELGRQDDNKPWLYPAMAVPLLVVLGCVITVLYKIKKRNSSTAVSKNGPDNTYDYCTTTDIMVQYPAQGESEYALPEGEMHENTLYRSRKDYYSKVIPKSQRQPSKKVRIYATINETKERESIELEDSALNNLYCVPNVKHEDGSDPSKATDDNQRAASNSSCNPKILSDEYSEPLNKLKRDNDTYTNVTGEPHYANKIGGYCVSPTYSEPYIKK